MNVTRCGTRYTQSDYLCVYVHASLCLSVCESADALFLYVDHHVFCSLSLVRYISSKKYLHLKWNIFSGNNEFFTFINEDILVSTNNKPI